MLDNKSKAEEFEKMRRSSNEKLSANNYEKPKTSANYCNYFNLKIKPIQMK